MLPIAIFALSAFSGTYAAIGPSANLEIVNKRISPDGYSRSSVLAGGTFPGPLIKGNKDHFSLNVEDKLTDTSMLVSTSIGTNYADGPAFVTRVMPQCPRNSFAYEFQVPDQVVTQYCDGLRGPLVVYDPQDPAAHLYESTVITLADWYHYLPPQSPKQAPNAFNTTLINGLGRYAGGPLTNLAVMTVTHGKRYSIDGHSMTIIEVDGVNHQPLIVDSLQIFAGQRYSFILTANQKVSNYWIRGQPTLAGTNQGFVNATNSAILRYVGAHIEDPTTTKATSQKPLIETALHSLVPTPAPGPHTPGAADVNLLLQIGLDFTTFKWSLNNSTFVPPTVPVLLQILSGAKLPQDLLPSGSLYSLPPNKVIDISIPGGSPGAPHPFHLHGLIVSRHVIRSAGNSTYNFKNPVIRDVVSTGPDTTDLTTFRFVTDNAGPWFLHCHIDWHLDAGLSVVLAEDIPAVSKVKAPPAWDKLCPLYKASAMN
ncbi:laccase [Mycena galericulata]|nr:laccase [Mycena galericulata]